MFAVIFICGSIFLRIAGKITKIAKIRTRKNFVPHGMRFLAAIFQYYWQCFIQKVNVTSIILGGGRSNSVFV